MVKIDQMRLIIMIVLLLFLCSLFAQNQDPERFSINPKVGSQYDINTGIGFTYGMAVNFFSPKIVYSAAYFNTHEAVLFGKAEPKETLNEFSLMLGRYYGERFFRIEGQFGLSLLWGQNRGEKYYHHGYQYETEKFTTIGVPLKIGLKYLPFKFMSVGIDLQANLNFVKSFFITFLSFEFGIIRNEIKSKPIH